MNRDICWMKGNMQKTSILICTMLVFIFMAVTPIQNCSIVPTWKTIYVDDDNINGPWDGTLAHPYRHIQDGINAASAGDTVFVYNGMYLEHITVNKKISLTGESQEGTSIDADGIDSTVEIFSDNVTIKNFTIKNCENNLTQAGINILSNGNTITDNIITRNHGRGIRLIHSSDNHVENNSLIENYCDDIFLENGATHNTIKNNILQATTSWSNYSDGIWLDHSSDNLIESNEIMHMKLYVGISLYNGSHNNIVKQNFIHDNFPDFHDQSNIIQISDSDSNDIVDNELQNNEGTGMAVVFSNYNEIRGNTIESSLSRNGISFISCISSIIENNTISLIEHGIRIEVYSRDNIIRSNTVTNNDYGIYFSGTDDSDHHPSNNIVKMNNIVDNNYGIYITVDSFYGPSTQNKIFQNNFITNTQNAYDRCSNIWDNGTNGGNYWDDYSGNDMNGDGVGDTPYNISGGNNQDHYPFMVQDGWFQNRPPNIPSNPNPAPNATGVSRLPTLLWDEGDPNSEDTVTYQIKLGKTNDYPDDALPVIATVTYPASQTRIQYTIPQNQKLAGLAQYTWRIVATDGHGRISTGNAWRFTTRLITDYPCFLAGTQVTLTDGSYKNIEDVKVGDLVKSYDDVNKKEITGIVTKTLRHTPEEMTDYYVVVNNKLRVTPNHCIYVDGSWVPAGDLVAGDRVSTSKTAVRSIEKVYTQVPTYDLVVQPVGMQTIALNGVLHGTQQNSVQSQSLPYFADGILTQKKSADLVPVGNPLTPT